MCNRYLGTVRTILAMSLCLSNVEVMQDAELAELATTSADHTVSRQISRGDMTHIKLCV